MSRRGVLDWLDAAYPFLLAGLLGLAICVGVADCSAAARCEGAKGKYIGHRCLVDVKEIHP